MKTLLAALLSFIAAAALAQSVPNGGAITQGQVWSAPQWNTAWRSKADVASLGTILAADTTGVVDATNLINAAIAAAAVNCGTVLLPPGTYRTSGAGDTLASCVTLSGYGATINYTGTGYALSTPSSRATIGPAVLGLTINIGSSAGALSLASSYRGTYRDIRVTGTSGTNNVAILMGVNSSGTTNPDGNYNTVFNYLDNIIIDVQVGTGVRMVGTSGSPTVVTLNTFINFFVHMAAVYGVEFNAWTDSNYFAGVTRISLLNTAGSAAAGVIWNSSAPAGNVGVYANNFAHLAVDSFGSPAGDARVGAVFNWTKQNSLQYYYQQPIAAGGAYTTTANTQTTYIYQINDTIGDGLILNGGTGGPAATFNAGVGQQALVINNAQGIQGMTMLAPVASAANIVLRGNAVSGGNSFVVGQDGAGNAQLNQLGAASLALSTAGAARLTFSAAGQGTFTQPIQLPSYTVATLPACSAANQYAIAAVTDATAPTYNGALTGGSTVKIPVFCTGSAWTAH